MFLQQRSARNRYTAARHSPATAPNLRPEQCVYCSHANHCSQTENLVQHPYWNRQSDCAVLNLRVQFCPYIQSMDKARVMERASALTPSRAGESTYPFVGLGWPSSRVFTTRGESQSRTSRCVRQRSAWESAATLRRHAVAGTEDRVDGPLSPNQCLDNGKEDWEDSVRHVGLLPGCR
jgi:hypothetical protein